MVAEPRSQQLRDSAGWYRALFEQATLAWLVLDPETSEVVEASHRAARMLQLPLEQLKGMSLPGFHRLCKLLRQGQTQQSVRADVVIALPDGRTRQVDAQAQWFFFDAETFLLVQLHEATNEQGLAERLVLTDRLALLGQLLVGMAHEIRNPLAAIQLNLHLLQQSIGDDPSCQAPLELALASTNRIAELIETTLNFARPTAQFVQIHDVHTLVDASLQLLHTMAQRRNVTVERHYAADVPPILGDARQLQQVFINLLSNAIEAIQDGGTVTIRTGREECEGHFYAVVQIEDTGVGISPEDLARIFEPFFTRKPQGTGLGLAIARRILLQHRGDISIHSQPGVGTCCIVRLPGVDG